MSLTGPLLPVAMASPSWLPVSIDDAFAQCRLGDEGEQEAGWFQDAIRDATEYCERNIPGGRQIMPATYDLPVRGWWHCSLKLPQPPLQSVTSIKYYDTNSVLQTVDSSLYVVRSPRNMPGEIELLPRQSWPGDWESRGFPVTVRFVAGYANAAAVPRVIRKAILLLVAHWFENREATVVGTISKEVEFAVTSLLESAGWGCYA